jgi:hypothetical protein
MHKRRLQKRVLLLVAQANSKDEEIQPIRLHRPCHSVLFLLVFWRAVTTMEDFDVDVDVDDDAVGLDQPETKSDNTECGKRFPRGAEQLLVPVLAPLLPHY